MLAQLHKALLIISQSASRFLTTLAVFLSALWGLMRIGKAFEPVTAGHPPFDLQNSLSVSDVLAQLPHYTDASRKLYLGFAAVDFVFPFVGGLLTASAAAFLMRHGLPTLYERLAARRLFLLFMLPTLFDWLENAAILTVLFASNSPSQTLALPVILFKRLKLGALFTTQPVTVLLILPFLVRKALMRVRRQKAP